MTIDNNNLLKSILASFDRIEHINAEDIPNIDLYMDQVTTFMDKRLRKSTRDPNEDKILTKTMINNYAKNNLLPPPVKKKYSKEHILVLIFIYYFKGILSINDIDTLLKPLTEKYFDTDKDFDLEAIYTEVFSMEEAEVENLKQDVISKYGISENMFADAPKDSKDFLQKFAFICMLGYDVYVKRLLIEKIIDGIREDAVKAEAKKAEKKASQNKAAAQKQAAQKQTAKAETSAKAKK
ncbi:MAG: DUF1836 domain-containing protein [Lachnospiraceae bacterium]|nr:DUF1836 domain-containing protein [Lachnospiraceae bacterium]